MKNKAIQEKAPLLAKQIVFLYKKMVAQGE